MTDAAVTEDRAMTEQEMADLYDAFIAAFRSRDRAALAAVLTENVQVWHGADGKRKDFEEYLALILALPPSRAPRFVDIRRDYFRNGFVQQNGLELADADGAVSTREMCLVFRMRDGRIRSIDEYSS
jgi:ketosteroid isomerase-like protein